MRLAVVTLAAVIGSGCTQMGLLRDRAAGAADGSLEASVYGACVAPTVGSLVRRYGGDPDGRAAWEMYCAHEWQRGSGQFQIPGVSDVRR